MRFDSLFFQEQDGGVGQGRDELLVAVTPPLVDRMLNIAKSANRCRLGFVKKECMQ